MNGSLLPSVGSELVNVLSSDQEGVNIDLVLDFLAVLKLD